MKSNSIEFDLLLAFDRLKELFPLNFDLKLECGNPGRGTPGVFRRREVGADEDSPKIIMRVTQTNRVLFLHVLLHEYRHAIQYHDKKHQGNSRRAFFHREFDADSWALKNLKLVFPDVHKRHRRALENLAEERDNYYQILHHDLCLE